MSERQQRPQRPTANRWQTIAWLVGPAAVVLAIAYLVFQPPIGLFADTATLSPSALPTATPFPTPDWEPMDAASLTIRSIPFEPNSVINDFAVAGTRLIAVGSRNKTPAAWYSDDGGETWTPSSLEGVDPPRPRSSVDLQWVAAYGSTIAALGEWETPGSVPFAAAAFTSVDAGTHWTAVPTEDVPRNITGLERSEFGFVSSPGGATLVTSLDGRHWDQLPTDPSVRSISTTSEFAASKTRVVISPELRNRESDGGILGTIPLFLLYSDGAGWSVVNRGGDGLAYVRTMFGDTGGFVAGGASYKSFEDVGSFVPTVWDSEDGTRWRERRLSKLPGREVDVVARGGLGMLAVGGEPGVVPRAAWLVPNEGNSVQE